LTEERGSGQARRRDVHFVRNIVHRAPLSAREGARERVDVDGPYELSEKKIIVRRALQRAVVTLLRPRYLFGGIDTDVDESTLTFAPKAPRTSVARSRNLAYSGPGMGNSTPKRCLLTSRVHPSARRHERGEDQGIIAHHHRANVGQRPDDERRTSPAASSRATNQGPGGRGRGRFPVHVLTVQRDLAWSVEARGQHERLAHAGGAVATQAVVAASTAVLRIGGDGR